MAIEEPLEMAEFGRGLGEALAEFVAVAVAGEVLRENLSLMRAKKRVDEMGSGDSGDFGGCSCWGRSPQCEMPEFVELSLIVAFNEQPAVSGCVGSNTSLEKES